jgi:hypothetical protein
MKFKDFIKINEDDKGLMGVPLPPFTRKPSDGRPFRNLGSFSGATPRGGGGGAPMSQPQMMKKKMNKK